jgi:hypothetical protein
MNAKQSAAVTEFGSDKRFSRTACRIAMMRGTSAWSARRMAVAAFIDFLPPSSGRHPNQTFAPKR